MHVRIKICGITEPADAIASAEGGADAIGLNFYSASPRCIDREKASTILRETPIFVDAVGVFVNPVRADVDGLVGQLRQIHFVQCHGDFTAMERPGSYRIIPAFAVRDAASLETIAQSMRTMAESGAPPAAVLLDAHVPGQYGGTGKMAPWKLLADFRPGVPILLAGGLTPENVAEAIRIVRPYGVDVASGVESAPGRKDGDKVRRFIDNARAAALKISV